MKLNKAAGTRKETELKHKKDKLKHKRGHGEREHKTQKEHTRGRTETTRKYTHDTTSPSQRRHAALDDDADGEEEGEVCVAAPS